MPVAKLSDFNEKERYKYIEDVCVLAQYIKELTTKLQFRKSVVKEYMEEQGLDRLNTEVGTIMYMSYDKELLNKDKTKTTIDKVNSGELNGIQIEDFTRAVGVSFPLIKINATQRDNAYLRIQSNNIVED